MGKAILVRDGIRSDDKTNAQTLQSAYQNGVISNAKALEASDPFHATNRPHLVDTTSSNIPSDLSWGIREVFFRITGTAVLTITGIDSSGSASIWFASATSNGGTVTVGNWKSVKPEAFVGATSNVAGKSGLVPAPATTDVDKVLRSDGSWGLPKRTTPISSIVKNSSTGAITVTYTDNTSEVMTQVDSTHYTVVEKDSSGNTIRTYATTIDASGNVSVTITEGSGS